MQTAVMPSRAAVAISPAAASHLVMQMGTGHMVASALQVVVRLAIPDHLADGSRTVAELAAATGTNEDALYRVLRALASLGLFEERPSHVFKLTPIGELLREDVPGSLRDMALWISSPFHFRVYAEMLHSVRTQEPAVERVTGVPVFDYFQRDAELSEIFNNAMTGFSNQIIPAALAVYDFSGIELLVDVAGGHGAVLLSILERHPAMRGILFDMEHVIAGAKSRIEEARMQDRCQAVSGDFFAAVPPGADAYIMKHIIHDWDDDRSLTILNNIREAMGRRRGRVILLDSVIEPGNRPDLGKIIDLEMLLMTGGRERTAEEFDALFARAGFELTRIVRTASPLCVIEAWAT